MDKSYQYTIRSFRGCDVANTYDEALTKADKMVDEIIPQWAEEFWWAEIRNNVTGCSKIVYKYKIGLVRPLHLTTWLHLT